jgi:hypothetical protein
MYKIETDYKLNIIRYSHSGNIPLKEIGDVWKELLNMNEFVNLKYNLLSDYRNANFEFSVSNSDVIMDFFQTIKHILNGKKEAVITDKPLTTAVSIMFEKKTLSELGFDVRVFSTENAALAWLTIKIDPQ